MNISRRQLVIAISLLSAIVGFIAVGSGVVYLGLYNVGADVPHVQPIYWLAETVRDRSIAVRAHGITPPPLDDPKRIAAGAAEYAEMCSTCHLAPGNQESETAEGLYPRPPNLTKATDLSAAEQFWVLKHGIKMSGMPAWGKTHSDELLWDIVAFLRKLPRLSPEGYDELVKASPESHEMMMQGPGQMGHKD